MTLNFIPAHFISNSAFSVKLMEKSSRNPLPDHLLFLAVCFTPTPTPSSQFSYWSHFISELVGTPLHFFQLIAHIRVFCHFSCGGVWGRCRSGFALSCFVSLEDSEKEEKQCG